MWVSMKTQKTWAQHPRIAFRGATVTHCWFFMRRAKKKPKSATSSCVPRQSARKLATWIGATGQRPVGKHGQKNADEDLASANSKVSKKDQNPFKIRLLQLKWAQT